jgi:hypothetical protein
LETERGEDGGGAAFKVAVHGPVLHHEVAVEGKTSLSSSAVAPAFEEDEKKDKMADDSDTADDPADDSCSPWSGF